MTTQRFPIGTRYTRHVPGMSSNVAQDCTVTNFLVTRNLAGEVVKTRYVATHAFCGQTVEDVDVLEITISRGSPRVPSDEVVA